MPRLNTAEIKRIADKYVNPDGSAIDRRAEAKKKDERDAAVEKLISFIARNHGDSPIMTEAHFDCVKALAVLAERPLSVIAEKVAKLFAVYAPAPKPEKKTPKPKATKP